MGHSYNRHGATRQTLTHSRTDEYADRAWSIKRMNNQRRHMHPPSPPPSPGSGMPSRPPCHPGIGCGSSRLSVTNGPMHAPPDRPPLSGSPGYIPAPTDRVAPIYASLCRDWRSLAAGSVGLWRTGAGQNASGWQRAGDPGLMTESASRARARRDEGEGWRLAADGWRLAANRWRRDGGGWRQRNSCGGWRLAAADG